MTEPYDDDDDDPDVEPHPIIREAIAAARGKLTPEQITLLRHLLPAPSSAPARSRAEE
jgi:hypothetical protein